MTDATGSIDGLNTSTIGLLDLRRRLAIIPQDAALFEGTIRDNLDPRHVHDDTELWSVLGHARLKDYVSNLPGQLDAAIHEAGKSTLLGTQARQDTGGCHVAGAPPIPAGAHFANHG